MLQGLLSIQQKNIRILRIQRKDSKNIVRELKSELAREISTNILTRTSGVYQGTFRNAVIVCESDADALFYEAVLGSIGSQFGNRADILFVHGAGKQRVAKLVATSRALGVPTAAIVDIDVLNDQSLFKEMTAAFGIEWTTISASWNIVRSAIDHQKAGLSLDQLIVALRKLVDDLSNKTTTLKKLGGDVRDLLGKNAPWDSVKRAGRRGFPGGDVVAAYDAISEVCSGAGLWILNVGELEGFCKSINSKGATWVETVLAERSLTDDVELQEARELLTEVRTFLES